MDKKRKMIQPKKSLLLEKVKFYESFFKNSFVLDLEEKDFVDKNVYKLYKKQVDKAKAILNHKDLFFEKD